MFAFQAMRGFGAPYFPVGYGYPPFLGYGYPLGYGFPCAGGGGYPYYM